MNTSHRFLSAVAVALLLPLYAAANSPYIDRVYEYVPAPGQFINTLPAVTDNPARAAEEQIAHNQGGMVCLGAWGGYIVFGFDHPVVNVPNEYDLLVEGNAFYYSNDDPTHGNSEPGIICVSQDSNGNGLPDDPWYEIKGSGHDHPLAFPGYQITYFRTPAEHQPTPHPTLKFLTDTSLIAWADNLGNTGYLPQNTFHRQDYFPAWVDADQLTFTGTLLPATGVDLQGTGYNYTVACYDYGYADNHPNTSEQAKINLDWATDADGQPVRLTHIDFVKVYTGVYQVCGTAGEVSTEVTGAQDLHPEQPIPSALLPCHIDDTDRLHIRLRNGMLCVQRGDTFYSLTGQKL